MTVLFPSQETPIPPFPPISKPFCDRWTLPPFPENSLRRRVLLLSVKLMAAIVLCVCLPTTIPSAAHGSMWIQSCMIWKNPLPKIRFAPSSTRRKQSFPLSIRLWIPTSYNCFLAKTHRL